jgi:hypothetical protein
MIHVQVNRVAERVSVVSLLLKIHGEELLCFDAGREAFSVVVENDHVLIRLHLINRDGWDH